MNARLPRTRTPAVLTVWNDLISVKTGERLQFVDLTDLVAGCVFRSRISQGLVNVQTRHTTTGILVNENEPLLLRDLEDMFERWAPQGALYRHDDLEARGPGLPPDERPNGHAHARAALLRTSEALNVVDGRIQLGRWQRIFLVDLDGERDRSVSVLVMGLGEEPVSAIGEVRRMPGQTTTILR